jgi:hypothetical protein
MRNYLDRFMDSLESQDARKVYCIDCQWLGRTGSQTCYHPSALVPHDTPLRREISNQKIAERNANNTCPDFEEGDSYFARLHQERQAQEAQEEADARATLLAHAVHHRWWFLRPFPRLTRALVVALFALGDGLVWLFDALGVRTVVWLLMTVCVWVLLSVFF